MRPCQLANQNKMTHPTVKHPADARICVAPMMAWTDKHCRYLHRLFSPSALLFTEMVTTGALLHGKQWHQLDFDAQEHPVALQLGGNDPSALAECANRAAQRGYDEVNLNVGCPSDRVQQGTFGACLMKSPHLVADCVAAMQDNCEAIVSVKCRLGIDDEDSDERLLEFIDTVSDAGCRRFYVHARKAILGGLSPAQNRSIPPLQPERVARLKQIRPNLEIIINGGIVEIDQAKEHLKWADGVMIGRAAYQRPMFLTELEDLLSNLDSAEPTNSSNQTDTALLSLESILARYMGYVDAQLRQGTPLHAMTRHMLSLCNGRPGARRYRQTLSDNRRLKRNELSLLHEALAHVFKVAA